jgi:hypothetical protein
MQFPVNAEKLGAGNMALKAGLFYGFGGVINNCHVKIFADNIRRVFG